MVQLGEGVKSIDLDLLKLSYSTHCFMEIKFIPGGVKSIRWAH